MAANQLSRRQTMRMAGLACVGGLAGCQIGGGSPSGPPALAPAPGGQDDAGALRTINADYAREEQSSKAYDFVKRELQNSIFTELFGTRLEVDRISGMASFDGGDVLAGDIDAETIIERLQTREYERTATYRNHDLFVAGGEAETVVAVGDFAVRAEPPSFSTADPGEVVRATLDAAVSGENRWIDASDRVAATFEAMGEGYHRVMEVGPPDTEYDIVGSGWALSIVDGRTRDRSCLVFVDRAARQQFEDEATKQRFFTGDPSEEEIEADGRTVVYDRYLD